VRGLIHRLYEARWALRVMAVTGAAAGVAWALCLPMGTTPSAFAAASSVYAAQLSVRSSLVDGLKRSALITLSLLLAVVILHVVGLSVWAVVVLVFVSMAAGRLLGLGMSGALQIPATAIFVLALGPSVSDWQLLARVLATLVGALVGAVSAVAGHAGDPQVQVRRSVAEIARSAAQLLDDMGTGLALGLSQHDASQWLSRSRQLDDDTAERRRGVDQAVSFLRWDPFGHRDDAAKLSQLFVSTEHSVFQVRDIARTLFEVSLEERPRAIASGLVTLLQSTAAAFRLQAANLEGEDLSLDSALATVRALHRESLGNVREADDTGVWLASGSVLSDVERMVEQLEGSTPALRVKPNKPPSRKLRRPGDRRSAGDPA
jgi:uncharacterized membrane protein YgaE (UPF0421/DUF939 family)